MGSGATDFRVGSKVGGCILQERLGGGSFGSVWRAQEASSGRTVAIKLLTGVLSARGRADLRAEVELLAATASSRSPHVVRVFAAGTEPVPYVVMEYIDGTDLASRLHELGKLPVGEALRVGIAVADALATLEDVGIIHRDLKPANVMLDRTGCVKLTDFGIAKIVGYQTVTATGQLPMTMAYAAPEVWEGNATNQSDLYALGVLLYECLTGAPPFVGSYASLYRQHTSVPPDMSALPDDAPPTLRELIAACLEKTLDARPRHASDCLDLLRRAEAELKEVGTGRVAVEPHKFGPWIRREAHPTESWAWRCVHESTGQQATVEVHFASDLAYGMQLRRAVQVNRKLVPFGAEELLGTNRLLLRPGESWQNPPPGEFCFWVARREVAIPASHDAVTLPALRKIVNTLVGLIDVSVAQAIPISLRPEDVVLLPGGGLHVRRVGLAPPGDESSEEQALEFVRSLPLDDEAKEIVSSSEDLRSLHATLTAMPDLSDQDDYRPGTPLELGVARPSEAGTPAQSEIDTSLGPLPSPTAEDESAPTIAGRLENGLLEWEQADMEEMPVLSPVPSATLQRYVTRLPEWSRNAGLPRALIYGVVAAGLIVAILLLIITKPWDTGTSMPKMTHGTATVLPGRELMRETFDSPASGRLDAFSEPGKYSFGYENGEYVMKKLDAETSEPLVLGLSSLGRHSDTSIQADVRLAGETADRYVGMACRYQEDAASMYPLEVNPSRSEFSIVRYDEGRPFVLFRGSSPEVNRGTGTNSLIFTCTGDEISASVNEAMATVHDTTYRDGYVYLWVGTGTPGVVVASFDNLVIIAGTTSQGSRTGGALDPTMGLPKMSGQSVEDAMAIFDE